MQRKTEEGIGKEAIADMKNATNHRSSFHHKHKFNRN